MSAVLAALNPLGNVSHKKRGERTVHTKKVENFNALYSMITFCLYLPGYNNDKIVGLFSSWKVPVFISINCFQGD